MRTQSLQHLAHGRDVKWDTDGIMLDLDLDKGIVDFAEVFGNTRPVEVEIGVGKGRFLLNRSLARPEINFLGIEYALPYARFSADRYKRNGLENVKMLHADANKFFAKCVSDRSLWRVHIYFPDPWPKSKHRRRRLFQPLFLNQIRRTLKPGGQLILVTDHMDYFLQMRDVLRDAPKFARIDFPKLTAEDDAEVTGTNFERKYIEERRPFFRTAVMKYE